MFLVNVILKIWDLLVTEKKPTRLKVALNSLGANGLKRQPSYYLLVQSQH